MRSGRFRAVGLEAERIQKGRRAVFGKGKQEEIGMSCLPITMTRRSPGSPSEPRAPLRSPCRALPDAVLAGRGRPKLQRTPTPSLVRRRSCSPLERPEVVEVPEIPLVLARLDRSVRAGDRLPALLGCTDGAAPRSARRGNRHVSEPQPDRDVLTKWQKHPAREIRMPRQASSQRLARNDQVLCRLNAAHALHSLWSER